MKGIINKADTLIEALPFIRRFYGKTVVIKYGGNAMVNEKLKRNFALDIVLLKYIGINPIIVHGGGPQIGTVLEKMGKKTLFVEGLRVTDEEAIDIVEMVLVGKVNKEIVSLINQEGGRAVGLSGKDGGLIQAKKMKITRSSPEADQPEIIDIGRVGEVESVDSEILNILDEKNFIPVIAPLGVGSKGEAYNINADFVASAVAHEVGAEKLILLTDTEGVLDRAQKLLATLTKTEVFKLIKAGVISGGMLPKVKCCLESVEKGVKKAHIVDGRREHAVLLEIFTKEGVGTEFVP
ncbi:MAG: acetylglutamate kinase [Nitrospinota bacterium]